MKAIVCHNYGPPDVLKCEEEDLSTLRDLMEVGKITPVIDRRYRLSEVAGAMRYLEEGHARGKIVITLEDDGKG